MSRHDLQARPVYHHLTIVFAALAVGRWIEHQTGWPVRRFVKTARRYRTVEIQAGKHAITAAGPCTPASRQPSAKSTAGQQRAKLPQGQVRLDAYRDGFRN